MANSLSNQGRIISGEQTVATAGTAVALLSGSGYSVLYHSVTIVAKSGNTNQVYVGGSDVASTTNDGLDAGESITFAIRSADPNLLDLSDIYIDVDTNGEGVDFYATR